MRILFAILLAAAALSAAVPFETELAKNGNSVFLRRQDIVLPLSDPIYTAKPGMWVFVRTGNFGAGTVAVTVTVRLRETGEVVSRTQTYPAVIGSWHRLWYGTGAIEDVLSVSVSVTPPPSITDF